MTQPRFDSTVDPQSALCARISIAEAIPSLLKFTISLNSTAGIQEASPTLNATNSAQLLQKVLQAYNRHLNLGWTQTTAYLGANLISALSRLNVDDLSHLSTRFRSPIVE